MWAGVIVFGGLSLVAQYRKNSGKTILLMVLPESGREGKRYCGFTLYECFTPLKCCLIRKVSTISQSGYPGNFSFKYIAIVRYQASKL